MPEVDPAVDSVSSAVVHSVSGVALPVDYNSSVAESRGQVFCGSSSDSSSGMDRLECSIVAQRQLLLRNLLQP
jgi:hypothetical protein